MALVDTGKAIGKVTELLSTSLSNIHPTTVGRPEPSNGAGPRLNLFLYEALFDPSLKNTPLDEGQPAPLWLVLKYLLTAFDDTGESDTAKAHEYLGEGIRALQELNFLFPNASTILGDNPEPLKITFDETTSDLLSKIMQGSDEKYRFSIGFQVRPVMIATGEAPSYSLLVGVDYTKGPPEIIGEEGIDIQVIPSLGPGIAHIFPSKFEVNETLSIQGSDLNLSGLSVRLGPVELAVISQRSDQLQSKVNGAIAGGGIISAGSHPICVIQNLTGGRVRSSNLLVADLIPTLTDVKIVGTLQKVFDTSIGSDVITGKLELEGNLLGTHKDIILVALHSLGSVKKVFEIVEEPPDPSPFDPFQKKLTLKIKKEDKVLPGNYRIIFRVNGQQAKNSPEVELYLP